MSFLVDPPLLVAAGTAIGRLTEDEATTKKAEAAVLAAFLVVSIPLYLEAGWTRPLWRACRARGGRDWMLNSGLFSFDSDHSSWRTHTISAALFATYPLWLRWGTDLGRRLGGKKT
ncbi:MAG: hypothetical protein WDA71_07190 [Actinomycetota bacterium]